MVSRRLTRRQFIGSGAAAGVAMALGAEPAQLMEKALASSGGSGSLSDVKHIVILMQENRSFDHYFGTMPGVRGFLDTASYRSYAHGPTSSAAQTVNQSMVGTTFAGKPVKYALADGSEVLAPFELVSRGPTVAGQTTNDITHDWGPQHGMWNDGAMDKFAIEHLANDPVAKWQLNSTNGIPLPGTSTIPTGLTTMGYYRERDSLEFYRAVAETFTICDQYHCSVIGPTDPNRLMWMSGSLGAHSKDVGGPILTTYVNGRNDLFGTLDWPTMPELLTEHGVKWKVYQDPTSNALFNVLTYFKNFFKPQTSGQAENAQLGLTPVYPAEFAADVEAGTLPQVSWIMPLASCCEHPATPPEYGEYLVSQILQILTSNPAVWQQTIFLVVYDENGGFYDHIAPATPGPTVTKLADIPAGQFYDGEYVTTTNPHNAAGGPPSDWYDVLGPVGLGFRVPCLVLSPFAAGGHVVGDVFDHVSTFKLIESAFLKPGAVTAGLHVSGWRYSTVGDLAQALPALKAPQPAVPDLPPTSLLFPDVAEQSLLNSLAGTVDDGQAYPPPPSNTTDYLKLD
ncbi:MAG TPA: alkaline phosphatase family protein [Acidimicrobiales bacterium]|nr:alkaline phosphatase family protein [Acidimicrobiales bacterium]